MPKVERLDGKGSHSSSLLHQIECGSGKVVDLPVCTSMYGMYGKGSVFHPVGFGSRREEEEDDEEEGTRESTAQSCLAASSRVQISLPLPDLVMAGECACSLGT